MPLLSNFPITVLFLSDVPLFIVTHSLITVLSPISAVVSSPSNFKSFGTQEITAPGNIEQFFPILATSKIVTLDPIHVPSNFNIIINCRKWF